MVAGGKLKREPHRRSAHEIRILSTYVLLWLELVSVQPMTSRVRQRIWRSRENTPKSRVSMSPPFVLKLKHHGSNVIATCKDKCSV
jgi:hypothetical protein